MAGKKGWKPYNISLPRKSVIALVKLLKFTRTAWLNGAPFLAPVEREAMRGFEEALREMAERGKPARHMHNADDVVDDYVVMEFRKTKEQRIRHDPPCIKRGKMCPWLAGTVHRPGECMIEVLTCADMPKDPPEMWCGGREHKR